MIREQVLCPKTLEKTFPVVTNSMHGSSPTPLYIPKLKKDPIFCRIADVISLSRFLKIFIEEFRAVKCIVRWKFSASGVEWTIPNVQSHFSTLSER